MPDMALWRKHRFISLQEEDSKDRIAAGVQFIVKHIGSTCVNDTIDSEEISIEFYGNLLELFHCDQGCLLRLIVDLNGAVLYDRNGDVLKRFELSDIRDVIYSTKKVEYSPYFILVGREESELSVKAHVLHCEDKDKAKQLYDTFIQVFAFGADIRKYRRQVSDYDRVLKETVKQNLKQGRFTESKDSSKDSTIMREYVVNTQDTHVKLPGCQTWTKSSMTCPRNARIEQNEHQLNDSFTELARSRSCSSSTSIKSDMGDINSNKILWQDTDVFM